MSSFFSSYTFPRPLSKLYSDTKNVGDVVGEPKKTEELPELSALHRKFRIQRDRLTAWGLNWSDAGAAMQDDIEESIARAGLTDTVTSVLNTIKEIYEDAEQLQESKSPSTKLTSTGSLKEKDLARSTPDIPWAASDRARYETLARDLTDCIDTLYDLSRPGRPSQRSSGELPAYIPGRNLIASEMTSITTPKSSFTTGLPPKLDISSIVLPDEEPPPYDNMGAHVDSRVIGYYRQPHSSTNPWKTDGSKDVEKPVMIEYAYFDPTYVITGVSPPSDRLEHLLAALVRLQSDSTGSQALSTFACIGYFEDVNFSRYGLVYDLPTSVYSGPSDANKPIADLKPVTLLSLLQTTSNKIVGLTPPPLEDRFRLAFRLAQTFNKLHHEGLAHKDLNSGNIMLFRKSKPAGHVHGVGATDYALRFPKVCSFDLFSEFAITDPAPLATFNIYRHPIDPRTNGDLKSDFGPQFDMYSLALILLEVGLWLPVGDLFKTKYSLTQFKSRLEDMWIRKLAAKCGTAYMQAVRDCFTAVDKIATGAESEGSIPRMYTRILMRLQRCCLLDEDESSNEFDDVSSPQPQRSTSTIDLELKPRKRSYVGGGPSDTKGSYLSNMAKRLSIERDVHLLTSKPLSPGNSPFKPLSTETSLAPNFPAEAENRSVYDLSKSPTLIESDANSWTIHQALQTLSPESISDTFLQKERVATAAYIIQRAWRSSRSRKSSLKTFKRRVVLIQKHWRMHKALQSQSASNFESPLKGYMDRPENLYPTPEPDMRSPSEDKVTQSVGESKLHIQMHQDSPKPKLRVQQVTFPPTLMKKWDEVTLPVLENLVMRTLRNSSETVCIDLLAIGETPSTAKPTIFITCSSTTKVKAMLAKKFTYDNMTFDLKVRKGKIRRSKMAKKHKYRPPYRAMGHGEIPDLNPCYQQRPLCGASIGAFINDEHLPPVSFGGVVRVNGETYGMTVHHLLDSPSDDDSDYEEDPPTAEDITRSIAPASNPLLDFYNNQPTPRMPPTPNPYELSDFEDSDDEGYPYSDFEFSDEEEDDVSDGELDPGTIGDIEGVGVGQGEEIFVTQPAFDDVEEGFFPCEDDAPGEHLDSHVLGTVHASSGIRRLTKDGVCHEIDWALLKLEDDRLQPFNLVQGGKRFSVDDGPATAPDFCPRLVEPICRKGFSSEEDEYPNQFVPAAALGSLAVHCYGRTSGLKGGVVGSAMSSVRIYGRKTFSRSWHVAGGFGGTTTSSTPTRPSLLSPSH